jgi:transcriptional activator of comK gene
MPQSNQVKLLLLTTIIVVFTFLSIILFKTEVILDNTTTSNQTENTEVTILTSDVIEDQSWGSLAYKGKLKIEEQFPVTAELFSEIKTEEQMKQTITKAVENGSKLIIGHGREFSDYFTKISPNYPDVHCQKISFDKEWHFMSKLVLC